MNQELKIIGGIFLTSLIILIGGVFLFSKSDASVEGVETVNQKVLYDNVAHKRTASNEKMVLVEFADFQCPACGAAYPYVHEILQKYAGQVTFIYRHFPLPQHQNARLAASAAEAAGKLGGEQKFWEMYDLLYIHQTEWSESADVRNIFSGYAVSLGLEKNEFQDLLGNSAIAAIIQKDITEGNSLGINSTPTFFLNGKKVTLHSFADLKTEVENNL